MRNFIALVALVGCTQEPIAVEKCHYDLTAPVEGSGLGECSAPTHGPDFRIAFELPKFSLVVEMPRPVPVDSWWFNGAREAGGPAFMSVASGDSSCEKWTGEIKAYDAVDWSVSIVANCADGTSLHVIGNLNR